jgi:hypothetical protein
MVSRLASAALRLPFILCLRIADCLPLQVSDRIRTATGERRDAGQRARGAGTGHRRSRGRIRLLSGILTAPLSVELLQIEEGGQ